MTACRDAGPLSGRTSGAARLVRPGAAAPSVRHGARRCDGPTMTTPWLTVAELARARAFIGTCRWTFAKTVAEAPHEYCLRASLSAEDGATFDWFVVLIAAQGYRGQFAGQTWVYLDIDERKYWE